MPTTPRLRSLGLVTLGLALACAAPVAATPLAPAGQGSFTPPRGDDPTVPLPAAVMAERSAEGLRLSNVALYPLYAWPMQHANGDQLYIGAYVDEDSTDVNYRDYENGDWTYDTHRGTDIALYDFKSMDRGFHIVAAAPGVVTTAVYSNLRDRNCAEPDDPTLNYIEVANGDGTYTYYYHLRSNSMTVNLGEAIGTGQMLGMAGSSGYAFGPHLHFEAADWLSGSYRARDPWAGPGNPNPGLWASQEPYAGTLPFTVLDMGIITQAAAGGDLGNVDFCSVIAERVQEPVTTALSEPVLGFWLYPLAHVGDHYTLEIRRPDNSVFGSVDYTFSANQAGGYQYWYWPWSPYATPAGLWKVRILDGSTLLSERDFTVGTTTVYPPRFVKGGRSFRLNGVTTQRDTLHLRPLGAAGTTYALAGAPAFVSLHDSTVTVGAVSDQAFRSRYFQVVATNSIGLRDTAWYHIVDPGKPLDPLVAVGPAAPAPSRLLAFAGPVPFSEATRIRYSLPDAEAVRIELFDVGGRRVRRLLDRVGEAGPGSVPWDGRDDAGQPVGAGVYLCRVAAGDDTRTLRVVRLR